MKAKKPKFLRRSVDRYSKLGKGRKKKQRWKNPTGRDNKMREKRRGYPVVVSIGYKSSKKEQEFIKVNNLKDLSKAEGKQILVGKIGKKKKIEILEKAKEMKIKVINVNEKKYLKKNKKQEIRPEVIKK